MDEKKYKIYANEIVYKNLTRRMCFDIVRQEKMYPLKCFSIAPEITKAYQELYTVFKENPHLLKHFKGYIF